VAVLGSKADSQVDRITLDGQPLPVDEPLAYVVLYKPRGVISAVTSPDPRPTVCDLVDLPYHLFPVGRLDADSEGLVLLTNDGELTNRLTHPRFGHEKEYRVLVARRPDDEQLEAWRRGVVLEDGYRTQPVQLRIEGTAGKGCWLNIVMREGRKRQIREIGSQLGLPVVKIIRTRIGSVTLGNLKPREWRQLSPQEVSELKGQSPRARVGVVKPKVVRTADRITPKRSAPPGRTTTTSDRKKPDRPFGKKKPLSRKP
jgi:23S rRNA pseudouridine2605 synthase